MWGSKETPEEKAAREAREAAQKRHDDANKEQARRAREWLKKNAPDKLPKDPKAPAKPS